MTQESSWRRREARSRPARSASRDATPPARRTSTRAGCWSTATRTSPPESAPATTRWAGRGPTASTLSRTSRAWGARARPGCAPGSWRAVTASRPAASARKSQTRTSCTTTPTPPRPRRTPSGPTTRSSPTCSRGSRCRSSSPRRPRPRGPRASPGSRGPTSRTSSQARTPAWTWESTWDPAASSSGTAAEGGWGSRRRTRAITPS